MLCRTGSQFVKSLLPKTLFGGLTGPQMAVVRCGVLAFVAISVQAGPRTAAQDLAAEPRLYAGFDGYSRTVTTNSTAAQQWFNQGIQLLYGFNHDEAIRSFEQAAQIDPLCAMAWWGAAYARGLHINNPEMGDEQSRLAYEATQQALAALDQESPVEQALVHALRRRYQWPAPADRRPLDGEYAEAMEVVWHQFPNDPDVGALYAESLMNLQPWDLWTAAGAPKGRVLETLAVLERTLAVAPKHPGANHFYIHAIEASPWPERGVEVAERLQRLVPGSGHLVHMPSHIFVRVGRYADAAEANIRAIQADEAYFSIAPEPEFYSLYFLHNIHFLAYAAMMEGRYQVAIDAAHKIEQRIPENFLKNYVELADGLMPTALHVLLRFGRWNEVLAVAEPPSWRLVSRAERHFARSVAYSALGQLDAAQAEIETFDAVAAEVTETWKVGNNDAQSVLEIARLMAAGELAFRQGNRDHAFTLLHQAVAKEESLQYDEPPGWMQPVRHALGALLLADGKAAQAEAVYQADLVRHPNNAWALLGLQQALQAQGKIEEAEAVAEAVTKAWERADVVPVASCYCHPDALSQATASASQDN